MRVTTKPDETAKTLVGSATVADKLRSSLVQLMATMAGAERAALDVEQKRLAAKYGPDSPQAMTAAARRQVLELERIAIDADVIRQSVPTPDTGADRFPVYGRILTRTGDGVLRATVTAEPPVIDTFCSSFPGNRTKPIERLSGEMNGATVPVRPRRGVASSWSTRRISNCRLLTLVPVV